MPTTGTVHTITIQEWREFFCGGLREEEYRRIHIADVHLIDSGLCYLVNDGESGTWEFDAYDKQFSTPPDGIANHPSGCPDVPCIQNCDYARLCRELTWTARGNNPGVSIHCDNPCQPMLVTDAFNRLDWTIGGLFSHFDRGKNPYPEADAFAVCQGLPHMSCHPSYDFESIDYADTRTGSIFGRRGCLNSNTFDVHSGCASLAFKVGGDGGASGCSNPMGLPNCYNCVGNQFDPYWMNNGQKYEWLQCKDFYCCGCHKCTNYAPDPDAEVWCCSGGPSGSPMNCKSCQTVSGNCYLERYYRHTWAITVNITIP